MKDTFTAPQSTLAELGRLLVAVGKGHQGSITVVAMWTDGFKLAVGDQSVEVWTVKTRKTPWRVSFDGDELQPCASWQEALAVVLTLLDGI